MAYMCLLCPFYTTLDKAILETDQRHAGSWELLVSLTNQWSKSSDTCLQQVCWPTLASHWTYTSVSMMHDIMHNTVGTVLWNMWLLWTQPHVHSCPFHTTTIYNNLEHCSGFWFNLEYFKIISCSVCTIYLRCLYFCIYILWL